MPRPSVCEHQRPGQFGVQGLLASALALDGKECSQMPLLPVAVPWNQPQHPTPRPLFLLPPLLDLLGTRCCWQVQQLLPLWWLSRLG